MQIILDANVLMADPDRKDLVWEDLRSAIKAGHVTVAVPKIAVVEIAQRIKAAADTDVEKMLTLAKRAPDSVATTLEQAATMRASMARGILDVKLAELQNDGIMILETPNPAHDDIASRAAMRVRPFNDAGNGYRDTVHWFSVLEAARTSMYRETVWVSNDNCFAAQGSKEDLHPDLLDDLVKEELEGRVSWVRSLHEIKIPAAPESPPVSQSMQLMRNLHDWLLGDLGTWHDADAASLGFPPTWPIKVRPDSVLSLIMDMEHPRPGGKFMLSFILTANSQVDVMGLSWALQRLFGSAVENNRLPFVYEATIEFDPQTGRFDSLNVTAVRASASWRNLKSGDGVLDD